MKLRADQKKIRLKYSETDVIIRMAKVKEIKNILKETTAILKEAVDFYYNQEIEDDEVIDIISKFIFDNIDKFQKYILNMTESFTQDDFENLTMLDAIELIKEILEFNGIKGKMFEGFFQNWNQAKAEVEESFIEEIPKV